MSQRLASGKITLYLGEDEKAPVVKKAEKRKSEEGTAKQDKEPAPKMKFSMKPSTSKVKPQPLKMTLAKPQPVGPAPLKKKSEAVAAAFNPDEESEDEEMPLEAKMKMRNIGKDTPTASGPNSFGKSKLGFSQDYKIFERKLMEQIGDPDKSKVNNPTT